MKQLIKVLTVFFILTAFAFMPPKHSLVGKWIIMHADGSPSGEYVNIYKGGTYDVTLPNDQVGERGYYKIDHSTFSIKNAVASACGSDYWGKYKMTWHGEDSVSFVVIEDSCSARRYDLVGVNPGLKRVTNK
jgi:hypothetical protein